MRVLVKGGTIVTAENEYKADILIEDEKISAIGTHFDGPFDRVIDATGKFVLPGGVDNHAHFEALNTDGVTTNETPGSRQPPPYWIARASPAMAIPPAPRASGTARSTARTRQTAGSMTARRCRSTLCV